MDKRRWPKATPTSAVAKFAASGKAVGKKDMGMIAMSYGYIYVAKIAMGANQNQAVKAFAEAEAYNGPSLILAYSHCIAQGINMTRGMYNQKIAVDTGYWPLFRFNPTLEKKGEHPFKLDSKPPKLPLREFTQMETRFKMLERSHPDRAKELSILAQEDIAVRLKVYEQLAQSPENNRKTSDENDRSNPKQIVEE